jgi:CrcB protein
MERTLAGWAAVGLGGAVGSTLRHAVNVATARAFGEPGPWATAVVNASGCAVIGVLAGLAAGGRLPLPPPARLFLFVGVLGGYTTFSSYALDTFTLAQGGRHLAAAANAAGQAVIGLAAVTMGYLAAVEW